MHTLKHSAHNMGETFGTYNISQVYINTNLQRKFVNIPLPIVLSIWFGCSKEPSHWDNSFEYPQHMFWLKNKKSIFLGYKLLTKGLTYAVSEGLDMPSHVRSLATAFNILRLTFYLSWKLLLMYCTKLTLFCQTVDLIPIQINSCILFFFHDFVVCWHFLKFTFSKIL